RDFDKTHTVIMVQIENEAGILGSDRCYCMECNARFEGAHLEGTWGVNAPEAFSACSLARYMERLAGEAKAIHPLPMYINFALSPPVGSIPGHYPSGGAVPEVLDLFRQNLQHVDLVAPDIYSSGFSDFHRLCQIYSASDNPLYIAEHSSSPTGRAERNVFYALG